MAHGAITTTHAADLTDDELNQANAAVLREFGAAPLRRDDMGDRLWFFLKEGAAIVAMGGLQTVEPVLVAGAAFSVRGFVEVIANVKGRGYGTRVVTAMRAALLSQDLTGIGFCRPAVRGFYEACGLAIETGSTQRFVYQTEDRAITNQDGQILFYQESSARFMATVLADPSHAVLLPTDGLW